MEVSYSKLQFSSNHGFFDIRTTKDKDLSTTLSQMESDINSLLLARGFHATPFKVSLPISNFISAEKDLSYRS